MNLKYQLNDCRAAASAAHLAYRRAGPLIISRQVGRLIAGRRAKRLPYNVGRGKSRGSALFELLLAVLIFGIAALALSRSLNEVGMLAIESKQAGQIQAKAHSLLFEYGFGKELVEGEVELLSEDAGNGESVKYGGVTYQLVVEAVEMENMEGLVLPDLFKITVNANWEEAGQPQQFTAEALRYAPLYR